MHDNAREIRTMTRPLGGSARQPPTLLSLVLSEDSNRDAASPLTFARGGGPDRAGRPCGSCAGRAVRTAKTRAARQQHDFRDSGGSRSRIVEVQTQTQPNGALQLTNTDAAPSALRSPCLLSVLAAECHVGRM